MADSGASQPNPGAAGYDAAQNGQQSGGHMVPPPLHIPQNTNPIPTAITSPLSGGDAGGMMSPTSAGFRRAAPEPNKRALYIGGLDQRVTEDVLRQIFETTGHVQNVKIIPDKNVSQAYSKTFQNMVHEHVTDREYRRLRATITGSSSTMTPVLLNGPCRLSMVGAFISR